MIHCSESDFNVPEGSSNLLPNSPISIYFADDTPLPWNSLLLPLLNFRYMLSHLLDVLLRMILPCLLASLFLQKEFIVTREFIVYSY